MPTRSIAAPRSRAGDAASPTRLVSERQLEVEVATEAYRPEAELEDVDPPSVNRRDVRTSRSGRSTVAR